MYLVFYISKEVIYIQGCSIIFPNNGVEVTKNFCSQSCTNTLGILTENSVPHRKIESLRLSDTLKPSSKQTKLQKEMHL